MTDEAKGTQEVERPNPRPKGHPEHLPWPPTMREYPEDHPARRDEESKEPFNANWAREDFGDAFVNEVMEKQTTFRGDWSVLALLLRCVEVAKQNDPNCLHASRFAQWNEIERHLRSCGVQLHLERANFSVAQLAHANLHNAHLEHARLDSARLARADLTAIHLEHADLRRAHLNHAELRFAHLEHATLRFAHLEHANLFRAHLEHADLYKAHLDGVDLTHALLDHADVRGAQGIIFNKNPVDRLHIEGNASDPWSGLRREYTGPRFFLHLILLIAFLLPFAARGLHLSALAEVHSVAEKIVERVDATLDAATSETAARDIETLRTYKEQFEQSHRKIPAVWVLVGGAKGWVFVLLTTVLVAYNILRYILTRQVSALRDAEERAKITPGKDEYLPLYRLNRWASVLFWIAIASFVINAAAWALTTWVWVPVPTA